MKHEYCLNLLRYLVGKNLFILENVLEIPFVFEVELLELANPFVLESDFFFNHMDKLLVVENQSTPQYNLKTKSDHSVIGHGIGGINFPDIMA